MKKLILICFIYFIAVGMGCAQDAKKVLVLDDFELDIIAGPAGTIGSENGNGSTVEVSADKVNKKSGGQSLKITYDAVSGGFIRVARSFKSDIDWTNYGAISFYLLGAGLGTKIEFDVKDANDEIFRFMVTDDLKDWKLVVCPFDQFFARGDLQPANAMANAALDFPIKSFQFEPIAVAKGTINIDEVALEPLN